MPRLSVTDTIIALAIGLAVFLAIGWVVSPLIFKKDQETAERQITVEVDRSVAEKEEKQKELEADATTRITRIERVYVQAASRIPPGDDGDELFFSVLCNSRFYAADPQCLARGGEGGQD